MSYFRDILAVAGIGVALIGVWWFSPAAALVVGGGGMSAFVWFYERATADDS